MSADDEPDLRAALKRPFFKSRFSMPQLSHEKALRQGKVTHLAFSLLGGRNSAMNFLNTFNPSLGGRPLDVAIGSQAGFTNVMGAIRLLAMPPLGAIQ